MCAVRIFCYSLRAKNGSCASRDHERASADKGYERALGNVEQAVRICDGSRRLTLFINHSISFASLFTVSPPVLPSSGSVSYGQLPSGSASRLAPYLSIPAAKPWAKLRWAAIGKE
eukprot:scaffold312233_cov37-Tisochrysis_lutea.AAC.2